MARDFFGRGPRRTPDDDEAQIRVTDRRRIQLDDDEGVRSNDAVAEAPNLKPSYVEELEGRVRAAEQKSLEVQQRFDQLRKQLQSETDETRQRLNRAADERAEQGKSDFIAGLLPVLDNLERAAEAATANDVIAEGIRRTIQSFENALTAAGVAVIDATGEQFDPRFHEAVETTEVDEADEGKVIAQHTRGYRIGDRLLRPARVVVGRAPRAKEASE